MKLLAVPALIAVLLTTACGSPAPSPSPSQPSLGTDTPPPSMAPAEARTKAAALLKATDATLRDDFEKGAALAGDAGRVDWWSSNGGFAARLAAATTKGYSEANQMFGADNEPPAVAGWMDAFSNIAGDAHDWYVSNKGQGYDPALRAKVEADFAAADRQAAKVAAGG